MHRVLELGDVRVLGDVVARGCGQAPAHLTPSLVVEIHVAVADVQETEARIVTGIELVQQVRLRGDGLNLYAITHRPVAAEIGGLGGRIRICAHDYSDPGGSKQARS